MARGKGLEAVPLRKAAVFEIDASQALFRGDARVRITGNTEGLLGHALWFCFEHV